MISADVSYNKSNNNKNKRSGGSILQIFMRQKYLQNLKYIMQKKGMYIFHLILFGILFMLMCVQNRGGEGVT